MTTIKLTYKAFGNIPQRNKEITSVEFDVESGTTSDLDLMNLLYEATNLQDELHAFGGSNTASFKVWKMIEPLLSPNRTHTSLSIDDEIKINDRTYRITHTGFDLMKTCENCGAEATVYAMGPYSGDWAGYYCELDIPTGFRVTDKIKN